MKTRIAVLICALMSFGPLTIAQDYAACNLYTEIGDFVKAKQCLYAYKGVNDPGALCFYKMNLAINEGDGTAAKNLYADAEKLSATDPYVIGAKAIYVVYSNNAEAAKVLFDPVFKSHKNVPPALMMEVVRSFFKFKSKDLQYAIAWIDMLEKEIKQPNADWLILKGDYFASQGDHGVALNFYNSAIDADGKKASAYHRKGIAYRRIKNHSAAMAELETALKLNPEFTMAILHKAEVHFDLGEVDQGIKAYAEYFSRAPEDLRARIQFARALFYAKRFKEAEEAAMYVINADASNLAALKLLSYANYELGKFPEGLKHMETFFAKADSTVIQSRDYEYLSKYYQKNNADSLAIIALKKALTYDDADAALYSDAGSLMMKKSRFAEAVEVYKGKSSKFTLTSADNYNYGRATLTLQDYATADSVLSRVCEVQPNWAPGFLLKARASANLDPNTVEGRAFPYYEKFISLAESDSVNMEKNKAGLLESYRYMVYYHFLKKENAKSKEFFNKVLAIDPKDK